MTNDQDKKDEEKFEFTAEGEALGYIGMEQAQVRAMRVATETPGDYGPAYSGIRMAFDVAQSEDREDDYVITLSFRPQGDFSGRPGQEQFFIEKDGTVAHRQVLALPRPRRGAPVIPIVRSGSRWRARWQSSLCWPWEDWDEETIASPVPPPLCRRRRLFLPPRHRFRPPPRRRR